MRESFLANFNDIYITIVKDSDNISITLNKDKTSIMVTNPSISDLDYMLSRFGIKDSSFCDFISNNLNIETNFTVEDLASTLLESIKVWHS